MTDIPQIKASKNQPVTTTPLLPEQKQTSFGEKVSSLFENVFNSSTNKKSPPTKNPEKPSFHAEKVDIFLNTGKVDLLSLIPGSSLLPKVLKHSLTNKVRLAIQEKGGSCVEKAEEIIDQVVGESRPDLKKALKQATKNGTAIVVYKLNDALSPQEQAVKKQPLLKDSPKPLNRQEAIAWIDLIVDRKAYPALNRFFKEAADHYKAPEVAVNLEEDRYYPAAMTVKAKWYVNDPTYQLLLDLEAGVINPALFMTANKEVSHEVLYELVQYKSDHFYEEQWHWLGQLVNPEVFPNLHEFLTVHMLVAKLNDNKKAPIFEIMTQLARGNREGAEALGITNLPEVKEEFDIFIAEKEDADFLHNVDLNLSVAKDAASLGAKLAEKEIYTQIGQNYTALSQQIDALVDPEKYPDLNVFLHLSNDAIHKEATQELKKVIKEENSLFFTLLDSLEERNGIKHLKHLISMDKLPPEVLKDIMALGIEVGGSVAEKAIIECVTEQLKYLFQKEGEEWTEKLAETVSKNAGVLIQKLKEKATQEVRNEYKQLEHKQPGFYDRTIASWTMNGLWGSGAHLAFAQPESGIEVLVRLGMAMVGDGGLASSAATELISSLIPLSMHHSAVSKMVTEALQKGAKPVQAASTRVDKTLGMTDANKALFFQGVTTIAVAGEGMMSNYGTSIAVPTIGAMLNHFEIAGKEHFGTADSLFSEGALIRFGAGLVTTGLVETYVRPTLGDEMASWFYIASNLVTTMAMPVIKTSDPWKRVKNAVYKGSVSAANHFIEQK